MSSPLPSTTKALTYASPSTPPHLTISNLFAPAKGELVIKVHAAAINPVDIQLWNWKPLGWIAGSKEKGIGRDYSGVVVAVGDAVKGWKEGDEVFGLLNRMTGQGTFSEYITVNASSDPICKKPSCWNHETAAAVPLAALTAFACLDWLPKETEGVQRRVVVAGASGGVGIWCVQLAKKLYNCHVTGICSSKNAEFVMGLGADEIVDYTTEFVGQSLMENLPVNRKCDLYIDCVGGTEMFDSWHDLLHPNGAYVTIVGDKTDRTQMGGPATYFTYPSQVWRYIKGYIWGPRYANVFFYSKSELLQQVASLAERGEVELIVQEVVKGVLDDSNEAWKKVFEHMEGGRVRGKIVVDIA